MDLHEEDEGGHFVEDELDVHDQRVVRVDQQHRYHAYYVHKHHPCQLSLSIVCNEKYSDD